MADRTGKPKKPKGPKRPKNRNWSGAAEWLPSQVPAGPGRSQPDALGISVGGVLGTLGWAWVPQKPPPPGKNYGAFAGPGRAWVLSPPGSGGRPVEIQVPAFLPPGADPTTGRYHPAEVAVGVGLVTVGVAAAAVAGGPLIAGGVFGGVVITGMAGWTGMTAGTLGLGLGAGAVAGAAARAGDGTPGGVIGLLRRGFRRPWGTQEWVQKEGEK